MAKMANVYPYNKKNQGLIEIHEPFFKFRKNQVLFQALISLVKIKYKPCFSIYPHFSSFHIIPSVFILCTLTFRHYPSKDTN